MFSDIVALVGIILGFAGVALTFITFFAPGHIQKLALKNPRSWVRIPSQTLGNTTYRHRIYSGFTIDVDFSEPVSEDDYFEPWMDALHRSDPRAASYYVTLFFNGLPMDRLLFLQYDGTRNFIPAPIMQRVKGKVYYSFSPRQKSFADIVGYDYFDRPFSEVADIITTSRYNQFSLTHYDDDLKERLEALNSAINAFKSKFRTFK
ncbi:hypothetical protein JMM59_17020 [Rhodovulum sulfidophilum]|uniref:hypothetical protein n=1 Tax=Rhodovulum sulfidophilum TaxID=35806 RepID=UPI0019209B44|nr:hypothetical protein [Rhodovulum sulfidophilum]MBL3566698.1 hypothetical protein [Rhodovulum sulfidophilum]